MAQTFRDRRITLIVPYAPVPIHPLRLCAEVRDFMYRDAILVVDGAETVISHNGGWSADPTRNKPGRALGYTRFDRMTQALGCHGEYVEQPQQIRPALERAMAQVWGGRTAVMNVVTDWCARSSTASFRTYVT